MSRNAALKREAKKYSGFADKPSNVLDYEQNKNKLEPLNESQRQFISALLHDEFVIGAGAAGTGKTLLATRVAAQLYKSDRNMRQLILTRPNVEVGKSLGALPGEKEEKFAPYVEPFMKGLKEELGHKFQADLYKSIIPSPLAYMRGASYDNAILLLDEAQNTSVAEMKMFLSRVGTGSRIFITGDEKQSDIRGENGLEWLIRQITVQGLGFEVVRFRTEDCVRSGLCKELLHMIENEVK